MGGGVKVPGPSAEERALQKNQAELLALQRQIIEQQRSQNAILTPFFARQEGFDVQVDEFGNITSINEIMTEQKTLNKELELGLTKRALSALKGELPVSPGLEREIGEQEKTLREQLGQQLGTGYETSTPGIQALQRHFEGAEVLREGARTDQLTLAEQLGIVRQESQRNLDISRTNNLRQFSIGDPLAQAGAFGQSAQGFGQAQQPFIKQREMQLQASIANMQSKNSIIGAGIGMLGGLFSDEELKEDIIEIGTDFVPSVPLVEFKYKAEVAREGINAPKYIGVLSRDVKKNYPEAVVLVNGFECVDYDYLQELGTHRGLEMKLNGTEQKSYREPEPMFDDDDEYEYLPSRAAADDLPPMLRGI